jgi:hypothetical protein
MNSKAPVVRENDLIIEAMNSNEGHADTATMEFDGVAQEHSTTRNQIMISDHGGQSTVNDKRGEKEPPSRTSSHELREQFTNLGVRDKPRRRLRRPQAQVPEPSAAEEPGVPEPEAKAEVEVEAKAVPQAEAETEDEAKVDVSDGEGSPTPEPTAADYAAAPAHERKLHCMSCNEELVDPHRHTISRCGHSFHQKCLIDQFGGKIKRTELRTCPKCEVQLSSAAMHNYNFMVQIYTARVYRDAHRPAVPEIEMKVSDEVLNDRFQVHLPASATASSLERVKAYLTQEYVLLNIYNRSRGLPGGRFGFPSRELALRRVNNYEAVPPAANGSVERRVYMLDKEALKYYSQMRINRASHQMSSLQEVDTEAFRDDVLYDLGEGLEPQGEVVRPKKRTREDASGTEKRPRGG